jgi:two-component system probable response regulator PhcQ
MDYSDLVSAEAIRSGEFGFAVRAKIAQLEQENKDASPTAAIKILSGLLGDKLQTVSEDTAILLDKPNLVEFLGEACTKAVSAQHVSWLAFLIWFGNHGGTLALTPVDNGVQCRATKYDAAQTATPLATWIEQF